MFYTEVSLYPHPFAEETADVLAALIAPLGFESFSTQDDALLAYCPSDKFQPAALDAVLSSLPLPDLRVKWEAKDVATEDWNAEWEESVKFEPIVIGDRCCIHGPASTDVPACCHDIVIAPKMSFGSGHHETTRMLLEEILDLEQGNFVETCEGWGWKTVERNMTKRNALDMGTGTGILAILCGKLGYQVRAIEIDDWVAENAIDNVLLNNLAGQILVECGDASLLALPCNDNGCGTAVGGKTDLQTFDLILANINRNVLLTDMPAYVSVLRSGGYLLMSGFYADDLPQIQAKATSLGLRFVSSRTTNDWTVAKFKK